MSVILDAGLRGDILDQYLISIVESADCDPRLVQLMLENAASVEAHNSRSVVHAAIQGKMDLLLQLWPYVVTPGISTRCFEMCLSAGLVEAYRVDVLHFLLQQGARGPLLDHALLAAVNCLPNSRLPLDMVALLLSFGADPNSQDGASLCRACEMGRVDAVEALSLVKLGCEYSI